MEPIEAFLYFREKYPARAMKRGAANTDELKEMQPQDGVKQLGASPLPVDAAILKENTFPDSKENASIGRHLWVVNGDSIPYALESCEWGKNLASNVIKHSNLTAGRPSHSGGEAWLIDRKSIIVNANSGRYGADREREFDAFVDALVNCGYNVASMGFDIDNPKMPNSILIGKPEWCKPTISV